MHETLAKQDLNPIAKLFEVYAPDVAHKAQAGQFISLNAIMIDGTGMCGGCRVTVGNETRFACVDGPEFDGHQVDWDLLMARQRMYQAEERQALELWQK